MLVAVAAPNTGATNVLFAIPIKVLVWSRTTLFSIESTPLLAVKVFAVA